MSWQDGSSLVLTVKNLTSLWALPLSSYVALHNVLYCMLSTWHYCSHLRTEITFSRTFIPAWFWVRSDQERNLHKIWKLKAKTSLLGGYCGKMWWGTDIKVPSGSQLVIAFLLLLVKLVFLTPGPTNPPWPQAHHDLLDCEITETTYSPEETLSTDTSTCSLVIGHP